METLSLRSLNRATLQRQMLLERHGVSAVSVIDHLCGLNAQDPEPPYVGLWSRITGFASGDLERLLYDREVVRGSLLRGTQHIVTTDDYLWLRPVLGPMLERLQRSAFGRATDGLDPAELTGAARALMSGEAPTRSELGCALAERWPGRSPVELARSVQFLMPVVHPPPDGTWEWRGRTPFKLAEEWLGRPVDGEPSARRLVLRHLAAFGPATVKDVQAWSGVTGLRHAVAELRPQLRVLRDEDGRELFDLPDAPRPGPDAPAPVRFLAPLDNVLLAHHDRRRMLDDQQRKHTSVEAAMTVDGFVRGLWRVRHDQGTTTLIVRLFDPLTPGDEEEAAGEGMRLLGFVGPRAHRHDVRFQSLDTPWPTGTPWSCWPKKQTRKAHG